MTRDSVSASLVKIDKSVPLVDAAMFGCAVVAEWLVRRFLLRLLAHAPVRRGDTRGLCLLFTMFNLVISTLPIVAFAAVAYVVLPITLPAYSVSRTSGPSSTPFLP